MEAHNRALQCYKRSSNKKHFNFFLFCQNKAQVASQSYWWFHFRKSSGAECTDGGGRYARSISSCHCLVRPWWAFSCRKKKKQAGLWLCVTATGIDTHFTWWLGTGNALGSLHWVNSCDYVHEWAERCVMERGGIWVNRRPFRPNPTQRNSTKNAFLVAPIWNWLWFVLFSVDLKTNVVWDRCWEVVIVGHCGMWDTEIRD